MPSSLEAATATNPTAYARASARACASGKKSTRTSSNSGCQSGKSPGNIRFVCGARPQYVLPYLTQCGSTKRVNNCYSEIRADLRLDGDQRHVTHWHIRGA